MKKHHLPVHDGLSESVPAHCASARRHFAKLAEVLDGLSNGARSPSDNVRQRPELAVPDSFVPSLLRGVVPELQEFLRALEAVTPAAGADSNLGTYSPIPEEIAAVLTFGNDFSRMRQAGVLTGAPREVFEAFASLRRRPDDPSMAPRMEALSGLIDEWDTADTSFQTTVRCCAALISQRWQSPCLVPDGTAAMADALLEKADAVRPSRKKLERTSRDDDFPTEGVSLLAKLLFSGGVNGEGDRCGFMPWQAKDADALYEDAFAQHFEGKNLSLTSQARAKSEEYETMLGRSRFEEEWSAIKLHFSRIVGERRYFVRTSISDLESARESNLADDEETEHFQAMLDLLCWKYCLTGIREDKPVLMKPSVRITPYGTQIVIPAYMSLDLERDFHLPMLKRLHKARGLRRQGEGMSRGREEMLAKCIEASEADEEARISWGTGGKRYAGETRMNYLKDFLNLSPQTDDAQVLRMIKRGKMARTEATRRKHHKTI